MSKHTPGSWQFDEHFDHYEINSLREGADEGWSAICTLEPNELGSLPVDDDEARANARLIAAAPELLEALRFVDKYHAMRLEKDDGSGLPQQLIESVRKAIAKAVQQ